MLTCRDAHALIVRTIDDASLSAAARLTLRRHLASCAPCREEYETQHEVRRLLALHVEEQPPAGFDARLRARLAQARVVQAPTSTSRQPRPALHSAASPSAATQSAASQSAGSQSVAWQSAAAPSTTPQSATLRRWALRLLPIAATLAVIAADTRQREDASQPRPPAAASAPAASLASPASSLPRHDANAMRRRRQAPRLATDVPLHVPAGVAASASAPAAPVAPAGVMPAAVASSTDADGLANLLELTDTQRKQIAEINDQRRQTLQDILDSARKRVELERHQTDAAIERVLTPEQRKRYRAAAATRERTASQGWTLLPPASTIPLPAAPPPLSPLIPDRAGPPFEP